MNGFDFLILAMVAVALLRAIRVLSQKNAGGCAGCAGCGCEAELQNRPAAANESAKS